MILLSNPLAHKGSILLHTSANDICDKGPLLHHKSILIDRYGELRSKGDPPKRHGYLQPASWREGGYV